MLVSRIHVLERLRTCWTQHAERTSWKTLGRLNTSSPCRPEEHELPHRIVEFTASILGKPSVSNMGRTNKIVNLRLIGNDIVRTALQELHVV